MRSTSKRLGATALGLWSRARWAPSFRLGTALASVVLAACSGSASEEPPIEDADPLLGMGPVVQMPSPSESDPSGSASEPSAPSEASSEMQPRPSELDTSGANVGASSPGMEGEGSTAAPALEVADTEHCAPVSEWDEEWIAFEEEVLALVNEARARPADCGVEGQFPAAAPLAMDPILRCSARLHSLDMFERDFFDHVTPDGVDPFDRMALAGFAGSGGGENIAVGQSTPEEVMQAWMDSDGHCANVMREGFATIGIGFHPGEGRRGLGSNFWTQNFGAPPFMRGRGGGRAR